MAAKITAAIILGLAGAFSGFFIPYFAEKIAARKMRVRSAELNTDKRFTSVPVKIISALVNAAAWAAAGYRIEWYGAVFVSLLFSAAILTAVIDLRVRLIPNELAGAMALTGILFQLIFFGWKPMLIALLTMAGMMVIFIIVAGFVGLGKVGAGDVKLAGAMGLMLGYPAIIDGLAVMSFTMLVYIAAGLLTKKMNLRSMFPFAPFMMLGTCAALIKLLF